MRLKNMDNFPERLNEAENEAAKIRKKLNLDASVTQRQLFLAIKAKLEEWHFKVQYDSKLKNFREHGHLPSVTFFKDKNDRTLGGCIYIYDKYSINRQRELLYHEFVHIMDELTPTYTTDWKDGDNKYMLSEDNMKKVEFKTELTSLELLMPFEQFGKDLYDSSHNIKNIVEKYSYIETSSIVQWIALHDYYSCHYAVLFFTKNDKGFEIPFVIDEYCQLSNSFDINNILHNINSVAYKSKNNEKLCNNDKSTINNKDYYCFSFYEKGVQQPLPSSKSPLEIAQGDRMTIIGWYEYTYKFIQRLKLHEDKKLI